MNAHSMGCDGRLEQHGAYAQVGLQKVSMN